MNTPTTYSTRSAAIRAAKAACRKALGPQFQPYEGPDFEIHPDPSSFGTLDPTRYHFTLTPAFRAGVAQVKAEAAFVAAPADVPVLRGYAASIAEYTGVTDPATLDEIEDYMRLEYRTLCHLSPEAFARSARESLAAVRFERTPEGQALWAELEDLHGINAR